MNQTRTARRPDNRGQVIVSVFLAVIVLLIVASPVGWLYILPSLAHGTTQVGALIADWWNVLAAPILATLERVIETAL